MRHAILLTMLGLGGVCAAAEPEFTDTFPIDDCVFVPHDGNAYFSLVPGRQTYFSNAQCVAEKECDETEELWITVTHRTKKIPLEIDGERRQVWTRVVEEYETADGELVEISRNYFAMCLQSHDVYYFGEDVDIYEEGEIVSHEGAWLAGRYGALPGIIMPESAFLVGQRYFQEVAPGVALDRAEHVDSNFEVSLPAGNFDDCVEVDESTPLSPGGSHKVYCEDIGLAIDGDLEATAVYR